MCTHGSKQQFCGENSTCCSTHSAVGHYTTLVACVFMLLLLCYRRDTRSRRILSFGRVINMCLIYSSVIIPLQIQAVLEPRLILVFLFIKEDNEHILAYIVYWSHSMSQVSYVLTLKRSFIPFACFLHPTDLRFTRVNTNYAHINAHTCMLLQL